VAIDLDNVFSFFKSSIIFVYLLFTCSNFLISIM